MENLTQQFNALPIKVKDILFSLKSSQLNLEICKKYGLTGNKIGEHTDLISQLFLKKIKLNQLVETISKTFSLENSKVQEMARDIAGMRLLIIQDWLGDDVEGYIRKLGGNPQDYQHYVNEQHQAVIQEAEQIKRDSMPVPLNIKESPVPKVQVIEEPVVMSPAVKKMRIGEVFRESLKSLLSLGADEALFLGEINAEIMDFIEEDSRFKGDLENDLIGNGEILTESDFFLDGKSTKPTVANWLKDFFKLHGTSNFSSIILSDFVVNSKNTKLLDDEGRNLVRKMLLLYRNLKFYSDSMEGKAPVNWEIIPVEFPVIEMSANVSVPVRQEIVLTPLDQLKEKYNAYRQHRHHILTAEDKIFVATKGDKEMITHEFVNAVRNREEDKVIACLFILARQRLLVSGLRDNPSWYESVAEYVQAKYARDYSVDNIKRALAYLKSDPQSLAGISEFLQYTLIDRLGMNIDDSALIGVEVGQILGGVFEGLAYGNQETGEFEWSQNKIDGGKLVSEI